jgi:hypothetical protein
MYPMISPNEQHLQFPSYKLQNTALMQNSFARSKTSRFSVYRPVPSLCVNLSVLGQGLLGAVVVQALESLGELGHEALVVAQIVTEEVADAHEVVGQVATVAGLGLQVDDIDLVGLLDDELGAVLSVTGKVTEPGSNDEY